MRAVTIYAILSIVLPSLLLLFFSAVLFVNAFTCLDFIVFNPPPPPIDLNDFILLNIAREKACDLPGYFIPAIIFIVFWYGFYKWFFAWIIQRNTDEEEKAQNYSNNDIEDIKQHSDKE